MKVLVFDTETTGLPKRNASFYNSDDWPYIVQLSYILFDTETNKMIAEHDWIIKIPDHVTIPEVCTNIHCITKGITDKRGHYITDVLDIFDVCMNHADVIVGHNIVFDRNMIIAENVRNNRKSCFYKKTIPQRCNMRDGKEICNILIQSKSDPDHFYKKLPKQSELHQHLFNCVPKGLHNSWIDVLVCLRCFMKMEYDIDLMSTNKKFRRQLIQYIV